MLSFSFLSPASPQRSSLGRMVDQSTMLLMVAIGSLILILALLILFHQNANATRGYMLRSLERERSKLLLEEEVLNMQIAQAQSLRQLETDQQIQSMLTPRSLTYAHQETVVARSIGPQSIR